MLHQANAKAACSPFLEISNGFYTLQVGRIAFAYRRIVMCSNLDEAVESLSGSPSSQPRQREDGFTDDDASHRPVVFMFTGQGAQYVNMACELYEAEPAFRQVCDRCFTLLQPHLEFDLRQVVYSDEANREQAAQQLRQTAIAQPALFVIEYALAQLWMSWGVQPAAMIGHSIGEYVAACIAGVFSLEEALSLVATRGRLMQQLPGGAMLSVNLSIEDIVPLLDGALSIAAGNSPTLTVVSGPVNGIEALEQRLIQKQIGCRRLHTSHAFHSEVMDAISAPFTQAVGAVHLNPPQIPLISNVTGSWMTAEDATDPHYWGRHLRQTVRFAEGIAELLQDSERVFLEVGPGRTLNTLTKQQAMDRVVLSSLRHPKDQQADQDFLLTTLGRLWLAGVSVNWSGFYAHETRDRLPLPTYPFERRRYWIDPPKPSVHQQRLPSEQPSQAKNQVKPDIADWFYAPSWRRSLAPVGEKHLFPLNPNSSSRGELGGLSHFLVFIDAAGVGSRLVERLQQQGGSVTTVGIGSGFAQIQAGEFYLNPDRASDYDALLKTLRAQQTFPEAIVHLWSVTPEQEDSPELERLDAIQSRGFFSLLFLAQGLGKQPGADAVHISVVSNNLQSVIGDELIHPEKATVLGPVNVIAQEYPNIRCCSIDIRLDGPPSHPEPGRDALIEQLLCEIITPSDNQIVAYRGSHRWVQTFEPIRLDQALEDKPGLRQGGVYLITGGLGGIGLTLAEHLAQTVQAKLILISRSRLPDRHVWSAWLEAQDERDRTYRTLRKIIDLEALGAKVLAISADVANLEQMRKAITQAESTFGPINGVIHAAGVSGGGVIQRKTRRDADAVLSYLL